MNLAELIDKCALEHLPVATDSRKVRPGGIFVAIPGNADNGLRHALDAAERGAAFLVGTDPADACGMQPIRCANPREAAWQLARAFYGETPERVIGITGTNGKTTTAALLEHLFSSTGSRVGGLGTIDYHWPGARIPAPLTTPDAVAIHDLMARMRAARVDTAIMEVSSHALDQMRVAGLAFAGAVFTNLTQDHLDYHKDMESYFRAKRRLFCGERYSAPLQAINRDDVYGRRLLEELPDAMSYGLSAAPHRKKHLLGEVLDSGIHGQRLRMSCQGKSWELRSHLTGLFNTSNLLAAQAIALELGLGPDELAVLEDFPGVRGRLERVPNNRGLHVFVDYAHTPDALKNALAALRGAGFKKIITVFGCGGNRDRTKRPLMGEAVAELSDVAVLTSDNPRTEDPELIIREVLPGLKSARQLLCEPDRRRATAAALELAGPEDAVLIAGKGHEDYQIIGTQKRHYSDQEVVKELLN